MKPVAEYIRTLLYEHDYVTVPNFGAFIANYMPSSFNDISGSLMPPQKRIAFNEILKQDDGLLATYISRRESVTIDEAKRTIQNFVTEIKSSLDNEKSFHFEKIGDFSLNEENNLVFDPDRRNNFFSESFGFDSIFPRKVEKQNYKLSKTFDADDDEMLVHDSSYSTTGTHSKWTYVLYSLPVLLLSSGLFFVLFSNSKGDETSTKSSFNPLDYIPRREESANKVVKDTDKTSPSEYEIIKPVFNKKEVLEGKNEEIAPVLKTETKNTENITETKKEQKLPEIPKSDETKSTIINTEKRYLIVSGIFRSKENVEKLSANLLKNGFSPRVVQFGSLMKVIAAESDTFEEAQVIAERHQSLLGEKPAIVKSK
ncbi:HU domain-containing protein [Emticicia agri]|uniref:SPOR domain-containing protein n=1 Tax=Emticicia agri TaxID=2492393 RepID=A0A4Q5M4T1_9BACT|nr:SPOR domain-containing protein [Emticicia agri]RYU97225.1 SPOR domain-containing protein [Emticicia agri]